MLGLAARLAGVVAYDTVVAEFFACVACEAGEVLSDTSLSCSYLTRTVMELVKRDRLGGGASRHGGVSGRAVSPCADDEDAGAYEEWNGFV